MMSLPNRFLGGILLIVGTSIGAGMLALPISTAQTGFISSTVCLLVSWFVMTCGALLILEVNLNLPKGSNMLSMAEYTLGPIGKWFMWFFYLLFLYTLLSAYISGGSDVFQSLLGLTGWVLSDNVTSICFTLGLGLIVYHGIRSVDYLNRWLMFVKLGIFVCLVCLIAPHIQLPLLNHMAPKRFYQPIMVLITSFGFASIIPSLRVYFQDDVKQLRRVIIVGSLIPLICYICWNAVLLGSLTSEQFQSIFHDSHATTALTNALAQSTHSLMITDGFRAFSTVCMLTAFLGVSLGLFDFLADGLQRSRKGLEGAFVFICTFLPPLALVLFSPGVYLTALHYAGFFCVLLLLTLPILMTFRCRYYFKQQDNQFLGGGKVSLILLLLISLALLTIALVFK